MCPTFVLELLSLKTRRDQESIDLNQVIHSLRNILRDRVPIKRLSRSKIIHCMTGLKIYLQLKTAF